MKRKLKDFIVDPKGQWNHPGKKTYIPNANGSITMRGVKYPVLGIDDQGNQQMMYPNQEYQFPGNGVYEIPMAQSGGTFDPETDEFIGFSDELPEAQEGLEKKGFDSLSESQKALLQKGNNLDKVKGWYEKYPEEMQNYKAFIDQHNADDYLKLYDTEKEKFDESVKNNAEWHKDWYAKRAQLPRFKDVATQRLNNYTDEDIKSVNLVDPVNFAFSTWKDQQQSMIGRVQKNSETGQWEVKPVDPNAPPSKFEFPTDKLFGEYDGNTKQVLVNSKLVNQGYYDVNGKLHNQTVDHETDHKQDYDYPQHNTVNKISRDNWKNLNNSFENYFEIVGEESKNPKDNLPVDPLQEIINYGDIRNDDRTRVDNDYGRDIYQYQPTEVRSRLDIWRQYNNIDALKDYSEDEIRTIMQKNDKDPNLPRNIKELFQTIKQDPSNLRFIHNSYVSNDKQSPLDRFIPQDDIQKAQRGSQVRNPIYTTDPNDPRIQMYNDSLNAYNTYFNYVNKIKNTPIPGTQEKYMSIRDSIPSLADGTFKNINSTGWDFPYINNSPGGWPALMIGKYKKPVQPIKYKRPVVNLEELKSLDTNTIPIEETPMELSKRGTGEPFKPSRVVLRELGNISRYNNNEEGVIKEPYKNSHEVYMDDKKGWRKVTPEEYEYLIKQYPGSNQPSGWTKPIKKAQTGLQTGERFVEMDIPSHRYQADLSEGQTYIRDPRVWNPVTNSRIVPNRDLKAGNYSNNVIRRLTEAAYRNNRDPYFGIAAALQETNLGKTDPNFGHVLNVKPYPNPTPEDDIYRAQNEAYQKAKRLGYTTPEMQLQVYNGLGKIFPTTEQDYHGFKAKSFYGVPVPKEGIDLKKNPLYGKQIVNLRDSVLLQNPQLVDFVNKATNEYADKYSIELAKKAAKNIDLTDMDQVISGMAKFAKTNPREFKRLQQVYLKKNKKQTGGTFNPDTDEFIGYSDELDKFQKAGEYKPIEGTNRKVTPEGIQYPKGTNGIAYNVDIAPGVEIVDNMPDNLKRYGAMLPTGLPENEAERVYDDFLRKYNYSKNKNERDTVIDLTNQKMGWFPFNAIPSEQYSSILGNNYVERKTQNTGNPEDYAKNWITRMSNPEDTFRNKDYAEEAGSYYHTKDIPAFYGIEGGKFKVGNPKDFSENTLIVPVRNSTTPYAKIEKEDGIFNNKTYTYDKSGNKIWNLNSKDKFIVYSPKTKKAIFRSQKERGSVAESKKILEDFAKENPDAYIIPMDEGRFKSYLSSSDGLSENDIKNWNRKAGNILESYLIQDPQNPNTPINSPSGTGYGYNFGILKKEGGENLPTYQKKGQVNSYPSTAMTYNDNRSFYDSNAVIPGNKTENDPRYNDWVKKMIYEGKIAYDPTTGKSYPLNNKISVPEGRAERATAEYARKPVDERLRTNKDARKDAVMQSMIDVGNNPAFYAPGAIATGALASGYLPAIGRGVIGGLSQSLPGMSGVAGATYGNLLGSYAATDALVNRIPQIPGQLSRGEYGDAAANAAMSGLDLYGANMISPLAKNAGKLFREQIYNAVDPVGYGVREKILRAPKTWARNTFYPNRRLEILQNDFNPWGLKEDKIRMAKNRLDSWRLGLGLDQKYDTFRYAGDNTYAIKNMKPRTGSFADLYSDILASEVAKRGFIYGDDALVNIARRNELAKAKSSLGPASFKDYYSRLTRNQQNAPWKQMRIVEPAKNSKFTHSVYDNDFDQGIMGNYRWDVNKLDDGNIHFQSNDTWDINPWEKRGSVNLDNTTPSPGYRKWNPFSNLEFLKAVGGKPFNIQNNFTIDPKTFEIIDSFKKGGSFNPNTDEFLGFVD